MNGFEIIMSFSSRDSLFAMKNALKNYGIKSMIVSTPVSIGRTCGSSLAIRSVDYVLATKIASNIGVKIVYVYMKKGGGVKGEIVKVQNLQK